MIYSFNTKLVLFVVEFNFVLFCIDGIIITNIFSFT